MTMITPSYLGETIEYSSLHACRSTLEDPTITGRYVLPAAIFECLARTKPGAGGEIQLTDGLRLLAQEQGLWAYIYEGVSYDAGDKLGFLKATVELALQNAELGADFREYLKTLKL